MCKNFKILWVLFIGLNFILCSNNPVAQDVRELNELEKQLVEADNIFGFKLFKEINKQDVDKNLFISPLSVSMALGMTLNGANNETQEAMETTLEFGNLSSDEINQSYKSLIQLLTNLDSKVIFEIANSIWYRQGMVFEQAFIERNKTFFDAVVRALDFNNPGSADIINAWVDDKTRGKITEIVDKPIDPLTVMFLINAIYFKGTWTYEFDKDLTRQDEFTLLDGSQKSCQMMALDGDVQYFENDSFQAVDLPYGDGAFSMTVFLPKPGINIDTFIADLSKEKWNGWLSNFAKHEVALFLPKFKLEYEIALKEVLKALGMAVAFDPFQADFSKMYTGPDNLYITKVKHKTFVDVNEEGTEAAAVTSVEIGVTSVGPTGIVMRVDHPFVFVIRENHSQTILFMGKIIEPVL